MATNISLDQDAIEAIAAVLQDNEGNASDFNSNYSRGSDFWSAIQSLETLRLKQQP
ncbi:hypothetical protein DPMN_174972 [Dreissena polymorpha]|uniref:Uncharacterized protein n=1 Tax=Dreissena polymorpha TaxID=45954 RepID=A0A9D4E861_DREPO|nr:hypothetical protein DPMN_174972 [Dreissena polymorpha]